MPTYRLKNRELFTPVGFQFVQPQMNWDSSKAVPGGNLRTIARAVLQLRQANPHLTQKHNLSTDINQIMSEVDEYTATLCHMRGYTEFVVGDSPPKTGRPHRILGPIAAAVGGVRRMAAGVGVLLDWWGSGLRPVERDLAEARAETCSKCPQNAEGDWKSKFTGPAAEQIRQQLEIKNDMQLTTTKDEQLRVCVACECQLQLKVWVPLRHVLDHTSPDTTAKLNPENPRCWILSEPMP